MAGEHVILLDKQDKPSGMLEKYAASHPRYPFASRVFLLVVQ